jgi:hypothetical protein
MSCREQWSWEFLSTTFPSVFLKEEYRAMREVILFEEEKMSLPELMGEAERLIKIKQLEAQLREFEIALQENDRKEDQLVSTQRQKERELKVEKDKMMTLYLKTYHSKAKKTNIRVAMRCPSECRGFLSESFQCGLCSKTFCKECHEVKGDPHECKQEQVETVKELQKSTKPCPKCFVPIYKTDGCDQMFCTLCRTAFSWKTGQVEEGVIHNPHYFEMMRAGQITDLRHRPADCEQMPEFRDLMRILRHQDARILNQFQTFYQQLVHHRQTTLVQLNRPEDVERERIQYLTEELDERKFKQKLYVRWQRGLRISEERQIMNAYLSVGETLIKQFMSNLQINSTLTQLNKMRDITREAVKRLDKVYQHKGLLNEGFFIDLHQ